MLFSLRKKTLLEFGNHLKKSTDREVFHRHLKLATLRCRAPFLLKETTLCRGLPQNRFLLVVIQFLIKKQRMLMWCSLIFLKRNCQYLFFPLLLRKTCKFRLDCEQMASLLLFHFLLLLGTLCSALSIKQHSKQVIKAPSMLLMDLVFCGGYGCRN